MAKPGYGFTLLSLLANVTGYVYDSKLLKEHASKSDPYAVRVEPEPPGYRLRCVQHDHTDPGTEMDLTANPDYPMAAPYYKKIIFRVTSDPGARANAVRYGNADIAVQLQPCRPDKPGEDQFGQGLQLPVNQHADDVHDEHDRGTVQQRLGAPGDWPRRCPISK